MARVKEQREAGTQGGWFGEVLIFFPWNGSAVGSRGKQAQGRSRAEAGTRVRFEDEVCLSAAAAPQTVGEKQLDEDRDGGE